jgi:hypothetical protein
MKKIFLLSILSVSFLSAFCQNSIGDTEIINKINIIKSIDDSEIPDDPLLRPWPMYYRTILLNPFGGFACLGWGTNCCFPDFRDILGPLYYRGMPTDVIEKTCETIVEESDERIGKGEYTGSLTRKIAYPDPQSDGKQSFILLQMNWDNDPEKPYNGKAEIIISKTDNFGLK